MTQWLDISNKVVLVTGAGRGLGAGIAKCFAEADANVAICDIYSPEHTFSAIQQMGRNCLSIQADLTKSEEVQTLFDRISREWSSVNVVVNNAGIYPNADLLAMTPEQWNQTITIDLTAVFLCTQAAARSMVAAQKGGSIINIASTEAITPAGGHSHYAAAKGGVVMFSKAAALELGRYNIRVNTVSPGLINRLNLETDWPDGYQNFLSRAPLARVGEPEDVAGACLFLGSDASRWITGTNVVIDGGVLISPAF
jgi:NAD(P)-dependent dehydrogenase (short-subunit alcohol dehydrogenase family)